MDDLGGYQQVIRTINSSGHNERDKVTQSHHVSWNITNDSALQRAGNRMDSDSKVCRRRIKRRLDVNKLYNIVIKIGTDRWPLPSNPAWTLTMTGLDRFRLRLPVAMGVDCFHVHPILGQQSAECCTPADPGWPARGVTCWPISHDPSVRE